MYTVLRFFPLACAILALLILLYGFIDAHRVSKHLKKRGAISSDPKIARAFRRVQRRDYLWRRFVNAVFSFVFRPRWIVNMEDDYDFGCKIWGVTFFYYKDSTPLFCMRSVVHREVETKEFGHTISPWRIIQQQVRKEQSCRS